MSGNDSPFHRGEKALQARLGVEGRIEQLGRRMIQRQMSPEQQALLAGLRLLLVGTADTASRPWASALSGEPGFLQAVDAGLLRVNAQPAYGDPLHNALAEGAHIGSLGIELETRSRVRLNGTLENIGESQFEIRVAQSFGNCDAYIQAREPTLETRAAGDGEKHRVRRGKALNKGEAAMIAGADTFFIASQAHGTGASTDGIDVSHRGGLPGFVIVAHESSLLFPDYSGNGMFNTLGNLQVDPRAGLLFIDFETGDTLQITGEAEILWDAHHTNRFPGAERVVAFRVEETLYIEQALALTWRHRDYSPVFDSFPPFEHRTPAPDTLGPMRLVSINLSMPKTIRHEDKEVSTGIFKTPAEGRAMLRRLNIDGDGQADLWGHGGAFRTVYVYSLENYEYWRRELGRDDFGYGQFGENFTVEGMLDDGILIGDVFRIGEALVEVSQPRIPCYKLAIKMGIENFQNRFLKSGRIGFYFRVLEEGEVGAGDSFELVGRDPNAMSVRQVSDLLFFDTDDLEATRRALAMPALSHGWKGSFEERLAKVGVAAQARAGLQNLVVARKEVESETITSFYLKPEDGSALASFLPGQFLSFQLSIPGQSRPVMRTYSLSDSPDREYYRVSIKREPPPANRPDLPPGLSSNYLHDRVDVGTVLRVWAPRGKFHIDPDGERTVVLISAGVGLTPMLSMLNAIVRGTSRRRVWFLHGARNGREHAFGDHVRRLARENANVTAHIRYSRPGPEDLEGRDYDAEGRLDIDVLKELLPFDDYEFYLCGPTPFMRSLYCGLLSTGVAESRVHYEFFGPASALSEEAAPQGQAPTRAPSAELGGECVVEFARSGLTTTWDPECESILELAEHQGLNPPYSCRSGICRTCMCELSEGEVEYLEQPLNAPDPGCVLICVCRPKTKVVLDI